MADVAAQTLATERTNPIKPIRGDLLSISVRLRPSAQQANFDRNVSQLNLPAEGLEPTRSCDHWILSPARLPIPPRRRFHSERLFLPMKNHSFSCDSF